MINKPNINTHSEFQTNYIEQYFTGFKIFNSNDLTVILYAHLLAEILIDKVLMSQCKKHSILNNKNFTFFLKLELVNSLELIPEELAEQINQLNEIRNKFAHNINTRLSIDTFDKILKYCTRNNLKKDAIETWKNDPKLLFGLCASFLLGELASHCFEIE